MVKDITNDVLRRHSSSKSYRRNPDYHIDDEQTFETMNKKKLYGSYRNHGFNDSLLKRFFTSRIGKNYNDVYSELVKKIKKDSYQLSCVKEYVSHFVCSNDKIVIKNNIPFYKDHPDIVYSGFYIDNNNILRFNKRERYKRSQISPFVDIDGKKYYHFDNLWWEVEIFEISRKSFDLFTELFEDAFYGKISCSNAINIYGSSLIVTKKKSASKKEIKKINKIIDL